MDDRGHTWSSAGPTQDDIELLPWWVGRAPLRPRDVAALCHRLSEVLARNVGAAESGLENGDQKGLEPPYFLRDSYDGRTWLESLISRSTIEPQKAAAVMTDDHSAATYEAVLSSDPTIIELGRTELRMGEQLQTSEPLLLVLWQYSNSEVMRIRRRLSRHGFLSRKRSSEVTQINWNHKTRKVRDPAALKKFVDAVLQNSLDPLDVDGQRLARRVLECLDTSPSVKAITERLSRLPDTRSQRNVWAGVAAATLRDNYYRPTGRASR